MALDAGLIRETLAGYQAANDVAEQERQDRLQKMTPAEAFAIYESLVETWSSLGRLNDSPDALEAWRLETTLAVRRALDAVAAAQASSE